MRGEANAEGITISLWIHSNKRVDTILESMNQEMKDFHGRLTKQDAEFKAFLQRKKPEILEGFKTIKEDQKCLMEEINGKPDKEEMRKEINDFLEGFKTIKEDQNGN
jgi:hypothetical protein